MTGRAPALRLEGVGVDLGGRAVLGDVDLTVAHGELVGLIGPNGAGKTTLLRTILGLVDHRAGTIAIGGEQGARRHRIGYVPQRHEFAWEFPLSVAQVVATGLTGRLGVFRRAGRAQWRAVAESLDRVRMSALADRPVAQLSGGQRQRVLVARALVLDSPLLLLDEPFTGLDMPTQDLLSGLFTDLAREGRAVVITTHDIVSALYTCDRIALVNRGIIAQGPPRLLAADPQSWMSAFSVGPDSTLLRLLEVA